MAAKLKKGDRVVVIAGKDAGVKGEILSLDPTRRRAVVSGANRAVRHLKQTANRQGGRTSIELPIDLSNLMIADPEDDTPSRVGFRFEEGRKIRFAKRSGRAIDG
ncbi:MAG: 50S ribosomal protein L24 [Rhodobacteraceae bacterium]|nr:50S ribosomal protein L24 [Paracoccaceae bacterium]